MPEDAGDALAVEITNSGDLKVAGMRAKIDAAGPLAVVDQPFVDVAGGRVVPQDIAGAGASEIADRDDLIAGWMACRD